MDPCLPLPPEGAAPIQHILAPHPHRIGHAVYRARHLATVHHIVHPVVVGCRKVAAGLPGALKVAALPALLAAGPATPGGGAFGGGTFDPGPLSSGSSACCSPGGGFGGGGSGGGGGGGGGGGSPSKPTPETFANAGPTQVPVPYGTISPLDPPPISQYPTQYSNPPVFVDRAPVGRGGTAPTIRVAEGGRTPTPVPEPGTLWLSAAPLVLLFRLRRRVA